MLLLTIKEETVEFFINGKEESLPDSINVNELIKQRGVESPEMISVELNGAILERDDFQTTILQENDKIEFLYFMGGGCNNLYHKG